MYIKSQNGQAIVNTECGTIETNLTDIIFKQGDKLTVIGTYENDDAIKIMERIFFVIDNGQNTYEMPQEYCNEFYV